MKTRSILLSLIVFATTSSLLLAAVPGGTGAPARGARGGRGAARGPVPAPSLKPVTTPSKQPDADGCIQRWLILEPIPCSGQLGDVAVQETVKREYFPNQLAVIPHDGDKVTVDGADYVWHAVDTTEFNVNLLHFGRNYGKSYENVIFWAVCVINCPQDMPNVRLTGGSNAGSVWWVNGKEVINIYQNRQSVVDDGVSHRLTLKKGPNILRCAIINSTGATDFVARFLDADDKPLKDFTITLSEAGQ
jgi:hypothetical protein